LKELNIKFKWKGKGINSKCYNQEGKCIVSCDKEYYRPLEVDTLLGDSKKARKELGWKASTNIKQLVKDMVASDLKSLNIND
jgi:GDPmannose 4,6-dehydratase